MSLVLVLVGIVIFLFGIPWLLAATGIIAWSVARCCHAVWIARALKPPPFQM